jgi:hypothetical protein
LAHSGAQRGDPVSNGKNQQQQLHPTLTRDPPAVQASTAALMPMNMMAHCTTTLSDSSTNNDTARHTLNRDTPASKTAPRITNMLPDTEQPIESAAAQRVQTSPERRLLCRPALPC